MPPIQLSDLQLALMRSLWDRGEGTAAEVLADLRQASRDLAPTTVATLLGRLEKKGLVRHRTRGRQYVYAATISESEVRRSMLGRVTEFFFGGDERELLSHLVGRTDISPADLAEIRRVIDDASERESKEDHDG